MAGERIKLEVTERERAARASPGACASRASSPASSTGGRKAPRDLRARARAAPRADRRRRPARDPRRRARRPEDDARRRSSRTTSRIRSAGSITHIDLQEVRLDQPIQATVTVQLVGEAAGRRRRAACSRRSRARSTSRRCRWRSPSTSSSTSAGWRSATRCASPTSRRARASPILDDPEETVLATVGAADARVEPEPEESSRRARSWRRARKRREGAEGAAEGEAAEAGRSRASPAPPRANAPPVASRRPRLVARPARRRARQSRPRVRRQPPQRRLDGRRRARAPARRLVAGKFSGQLAEVRLDGARVALLKPETYMNESGRSVARRRASSRSSPTRSLVVHDEVDLELGRLQARQRRRARRPQRAALDRAALGTQDFLRLRIGVGRPGRGDPRTLADYVLSNFEPRGRRRGASSRAPPTPSRRSRRRARRGAGAIQLSSAADVRLERPEPAGASGLSSWTSPDRSTRVRPRELRRARAPARASPRRCPTRARVSEPALPLAARGAARGARPPARRPRPRGRRRARRRRGGRLVPRRRARRAACRAAASAGARASTPRRTSSASARARSTCSPRRARRARRRRRSPRGCRRRARPARADPDPRRRRARPRASSPSTLALAGYERVERVEERGQFAVRGGLVDVFPTTGASRSASSSSATRSSRSARSRRSRSARCIRSTRRVVYPAAERRLDLVEPTLARRGRAEPVRRTISSRRCRRGPDLVWEPDEVRAVWEEEGSSRVTLVTARPSSTRFPPGQPFAFEAQRPGARRARARRGRERARRASSAPGHRVVVAFPHRGEALRTQNLLRRVEARVLERRRGAAARARGSSSPSRRRAAASSGATSGLVAPAGHAGLPQAAAARARASAARAAVVRRPPHRRLRRPRGPRRRQAARLRDEGGRRRHARLPPPRLPRRRPALRPARADRQGLALHRRRRLRARALEARRQGLGQPQEPRARVGARARRRAARALRAAPAGAGRRVRPASRLARAARGGVPVPRDAGPAGGDRGGQGGPRGAAADGPPRLRRRRLRQDGGRDPRRVRGRRQRQADADARADDDPRRAALEHVPRALPRLPGARRDGLALPAAAGGQAGARATSRRARSTS